MVKVQNVPIGSVKPYARNPRHNADAVDSVARSIEEFGFQQPIVVDADRVVIAGHTRLAAAQKLGLKRVPVHVAQLTEAQARAYRLADNRTHQDSGWDEEKLIEELRALEAADFDLDATGFRDAELDKLLRPEGTGSRKGNHTIGVADGKHMLLIECPTEEDCAELYEEMLQRGLECRLMS